MVCRYIENADLRLSWGLEKTPIKPTVSDNEYVKPKSKGKF